MTASDIIASIALIVSVWSAWFSYRSTKPLLKLRLLNWGSDTGVLGYQFEVTNEGGDAANITHAGFELSEPKKHNMFILAEDLTSGSLPCRLEPHASCVLCMRPDFPVPERLPHLKRAFIATATGRKLYTPNRAIRRVLRPRPAPAIQRVVYCQPPDTP